jgi:multidrug efflux pump subunit AcrA (membrane-fusion protein)
MKNENLKIILCVLLIVLIISGCQQRAKVVEEKGVIPVKVARVELKDIDETLDYVGNIRAQDEVQVYPKVSGKIIEKIKEEGSLVEKGQALCYIDRDEVGLTFKKAPVESPLAGIVGRVYVDIGENVNAQTPVALVVNMDKVKIDLEIPEKYLPRVSLGQVAILTVDAYPQKEFTGRVTKISPVVDLTTRTAPIEIIADNPEHHLKSGMFSKVKLIIQQHKNVPLVLKETIMGKEPDVYVFVIENNKAILKKIKLGLRQGPYFAVTEGLSAGDLVVIMGQQRLRDNAPVSVEITEE